VIVSSIALSQKEKKNGKECKGFGMKGMATHYHPACQIVRGKKND